MSFPVSIEKDGRVLPASQEILDRQMRR